MRNSLSRHPSAARLRGFGIARHWREVGLLAAVLLLLCGAVARGQWLELREEQAQERVLHQQALREQAALGARQVALAGNGALQKLDLASTLLARAYEQQPAALSAAVSDVQTALPPHTLQAVLVLDSKGEVLASEGALPGQAAALAGQLPQIMFQKGLRVGTPVRLVRTGPSWLPIARPLGGTAAAASLWLLVAPSFLDSAINSVTAAGGRSLLVREDGRVIARSGFPAMQATSERWDDIQRANGARGEIAETADPDDPRATYWHRLSEYPLLALSQPDQHLAVEGLLTAQSVAQQQLIVLWVAIGGVLLAALLIGNLLFNRRSRIVARERFYRATFALSRTPLLVLHPGTGGIIMVNDAACEFYGYPAERLTGFDVGMVVAGPDLEYERRKLLGVHLPDEVVRSRHRLASGHERDVIVRSTPAHISHHDVAVLAVEDVTDRLASETQWEAARQFREGILDNRRYGVLQVDAANRLVFCNRQAQRLLGVVGGAGGDTSVTELLSDLEVRELVDGHGRRRHATMRGVELFEALRAAGQTQQEWRLSHADGRERWLVVSGGTLAAEPGAGDLLLLLEDVTQQRDNEYALRLAEVAFESNDGKMITNAAGVIERVNAAFVKETGYTAAEVIGRRPNILASGRHEKPFYEAMWKDLLHKGRWEGQVWNRRKNGEVYPEWLTISGVIDSRGQVTHYVASLNDISEKVNNAAQMNDLASFDPLTKLANRHLLHQLLGEFLEKVATDPSHALRGALLFIDIDNFKLVNDTMGHYVGDQMLIEVAHRLESVMRQHDLVARLGGDEFVVLLRDLGADPAEAELRAKMVCEKIVNVLSHPYRLSGLDHHTTASVGVTMIGELHATSDELLRRADVAMYHAKSHGKNELAFYNPAMAKTLEVRANMERELRTALDRNEFALYYQPQVDEHNVLVGAEALLRWHHPERGVIPPAGLIPVAEESGLIIPIGREVLRLACRQILRWEPYLPAGMTIAVNVSAAQFRHEQFLDHVREALTETRINPARIKIELTESVLVHDMEAITSKMEALRKLGISFALDDFGTGYSSLAYLKKLPLDQIKIDKSFVHDVLVDANDTAIAKTIIALCRSMAVAVIAEGVEHDEQWAFLRHEGCQQAQGYLFGRPLSSEDFEQRMNSLTRPGTVVSGRWANLNLRPEGEERLSA